MLTAVVSNIVTDRNALDTLIHPQTGPIPLIML